jgi:hypothetical protein
VTKMFDFFKNLPTWSTTKGGLTDLTDSELSILAKRAGYSNIDEVVAGIRSIDGLPKKELATTLRAMPDGGVGYTLLKNNPIIKTKLNAMPPPSKLDAMPPPSKNLLARTPGWAKAAGALFGGFVLFEVISVIMGETLSKSLGCKMPWNKQMDTCSSSGEGPSGGPGGDENLTDAEKEMLGTAGIVLVVLLVFSSVICASSSSSMMLMTTK